MKAQYLEYHLEHKNLPLFGQPWWLDAVCGSSNWSVLGKLDPNGKLILAVPYMLHKLKGIEAWVQPPLTQYTPIFQAHNLSNKKSITGYKSQEMIKKLWAENPLWPIVEVNLDPEFLEILGFSWAGFDLYQRVTFRLEKPEKPEKLEKLEKNEQKGYSSNLKRNLKAAQKVYSVHSSENHEVLFQLMKESYARHEGHMFETKEVLKRTVHELLARKQGKLLTATDQKGTIVAAILYAWDHQTGYYLGGGQTTLPGHPAPHSLLLHESVTSCIENGLGFDFCGSMIEGVARFFGSFGAQPTPFTEVRRYRGAGKLKSIKKSLFS